jgi:hypothetical protein
VALLKELECAAAPLPPGGALDEAPVPLLVREYWVPRILPRAEAAAAAAPHCASMVAVRHATLLADMGLLRGLYASIDVLDHDERLPLYVPALGTSMMSDPKVRLSDHELLAGRLVCRGAGRLVRGDPVNGLLRHLDVWGVDALVEANSQFVQIMLWSSPEDTVEHGIIGIIGWGHGQLELGRSVARQMHDFNLPLRKVRQG